ncbi:MAG TPA: DUF5700 domain-containing putative Zn-dependent protease, partial [Vicinamibacterales bacterium]|nr:DUF5700 domain-containing putative Zn-dependent protease [Vicinamibacterales bacterium]
RSPEGQRGRASGDAPAAGSLDVRVVTDEPEAVLAIATRKKAGEPVGVEEWQRLFASEGYLRLKNREASMNRAFTDEEFKTFVLSEKTLGAAAVYQAQLAKWKTLDAKSAAALALRYLPAGTRLRASIYPSIKPRENSFVFELATDPAIFFFMNPGDPDPVSENTLAHELHHVGLASACDPAVEKTIGKYPERAARVLEMVGSFAEGLAMVAAAGGPDVHPHAGSTPEIRAGWDRDVANFDEDLRKVEAFFLDVLDGRLTDPADIRKRHMDFFGFQGPWYTVGWKMAVTIEKAYGHEAVVESFCNWTTLLETYNGAAREASAKSAARLATWSPRLVDAAR